MNDTLWMNNVQFDIQNDIKRKRVDQVFVGFSGGLDSTFLLQQAVLAIGGGQVTAIHVNHGLSALAHSWQQHCSMVCEQLGCNFKAIKVNVLNQGHGVEAAARQSRYEVFGQIMPTDGLLLLGHHLDDQIETYFLRLFRGAGPLGLSGISRETTRDHYQVFRPMLSIPRIQIKSIASKLALSWIEDPSNKNENYDRNFLRQSVLPLIEERWPAYRDKVQQAMNLMTQTPHLSKDFNVSNELEHRLSHDNGLKLVKIEDFDESQLSSLLHAWLQVIGLQTPSQVRLKAIIDSVISARVDAQPVVEIANGTVRRHGPALYWVKNQQSPGEPPKVRVNETQQWQGVGQLVLAENTDAILKIRLGLPSLRWQLRQGGESMRPVGRSKSRDLKRLLQEYRIKPWLRDRIPLLFSGDSLVAVGDELISAEHIAAENEMGLIVSWQNSD